MGAGGEWELPGTLTLPANAKVGSTPVVVLVHGSGPNDRDETIGPNKPFQEIAWGLATRGVAVLRYDKRTAVYPLACAGESAWTVYDETINDAVSAVELCQELGYGDITVAGHSLGGMLIPRIAAVTEAEQYMMLAAPARDILTVMAEQYEYIYSLSAPLSEEEQAKLDEALAQIEMARTVTADSELTSAELLGMNVAYLVDLQGYDPVIAAKEMTAPLLILQGEADYQVTMTDFDLYEEALSDQENVTLISFPTLNHLFMASAQEKSRPAEYYRAGCVDEQALAVMADFVLR